MKRFLISRLSALGDVVCTLPVASLLKEAFPGSEIVWVVDPRFAGIVECCAAVDVVVKAKPGFKPSTWPKLGGEFDAAFDMQGLLKSAIVLKSLKCPKFGYHWQREGASLFSTAVSPDPTSHHIVDQYIDVVRAYTQQELAVPESKTTFALDSKPEDIEALKAKIGAETPYAVINPGAAWITKRWPAESFGEVIDYLSSKGIASVLIGGKAKCDVESAEAVTLASKTVPFSLVGQTSVRELVALIGGSRVHLGGDTGSTHIAAALGVPAIGFYSITRPQRSCPYGQIHNCLYDPESLAKITINQALNILEKCLNQL